MCSGGKCVECNNDSTCGDKSCIRAQHVCSDVKQKSVDVCLECAADSMCKDGKSADPERLRAVAHDTGLPERQVLVIAQKCWKIRWAKDLAIQVHFRACEIGADRIFLGYFRKLFRSAQVSAPVCPMLYTPVNPLKNTKGLPVKDVKAWGEKTPVDGRRYIYTSSDHGPMLLDLHYLGTKATSQAAVQSATDIRRWAKVFHQNDSTPSYNTFPVAAMWTKDSKDYWLPHEDGYRKLIATEKAPPS